MEEVNHLDQNRQPEEVELHQVLQGEVQLAPALQMRDSSCTKPEPKRPVTNGTKKWWLVLGVMRPHGSGVDWSGMTTAVTARSRQRKISNRLLRRHHPEDLSSSSQRHIWRMSALI